jgi:large subunit ribosomal protein L10e
MAERPAKCYRRLERPYTRQSRKKPRKSYVKGVRDPKIRQFEVGDRNREKFSVELHLVAKRSVQIRHNALEAARVNANKYLLKNLGERNYFLKILVYPHHVLRENPIATGAGADRLQQGMKRSFGKPIGTAARVKEGQRLITVRVPENKTQEAKGALKIASHKFPCPCGIEGL